jgi:hypothetical protein
MKRRCCLIARISVPCDDVLYARMQKLFPWGTQAAVIRRVCELLCEEIEAKGINVIELLISGRYNVLGTIEERGKMK